MLRVLGTLKGKLFGVVLLLALVSALIVVQAWRGLATLNSEIHHIVDVSAKEALLAERIEFNLSRVNGKTFEMLAADHASGAEEISAEIERMIEVVDSNAAELSRIAEAETQEDIAEFLTELKSYEEVTRVVVERALAGDREGAVALAQSEAAERLHHCEEVLEHVIEVCTASLEHDRDTADAVFMGLRLQMIVFSAIGIAVAGCIALVVVRATVRSIDSVVRRAREISEKDLSGEDLPVRGNDELADLTIAINGMSASLQAIVAEVIVSTSEVSAAATEIAASSEEMSSGLFEQTDQVNQIAAAIEEMAQSITEVASKSAGAADSAELSGRTAASGSETVQQAVERMIAIDEAVTASSRAVAELSRRGEQIGAVIT
ncbi:MAG: methyl-accepting chemotaxis protein, partial [Phycisphaerales bacterium JB050]